MTNDEILLALYSDMQAVKSDMQAVKGDMQAVKSDMQAVKGDMQAVKSDMQAVKSDIQEMKTDIRELKQRVTSLEMILENETNRNIRILAEHHGNLIDKLNQAIKVSDKTAIFEIQVNILTGKVERLEKELAELKSKIA